LNAGFGVARFQACLGESEVFAHFPEVWLRDFQEHGSDGALAGEADVLGDEADIAAQFHVAGVRSEVPRDDGEKGGFPDPVIPDERGMVARCQLD
jgi:hypothetical protein